MKTRECAVEAVTVEKMVSEAISEEMTCGQMYVLSWRCLCQGVVEGHFMERTRDSPARVLRGILAWYI
jgi:hypothetical protein